MGIVFCAEISTSGCFSGDLQLGLQSSDGTFWITDVIKTYHGVLTAVLYRKKRIQRNEKKADWEKEAQTAEGFPRRHKNFQSKSASVPINMAARLSHNWEAHPRHAAIILRPSCHEGVSQTNLFKLSAPFTATRLLSVRERRYPSDRHASAWPRRQMCDSLARAKHNNGDLWLLFIWGSYEKEKEGRGELVGVNNLQNFKLLFTLSKIWQMFVQQIIWCDTNLL